MKALYFPVAVSSIVWFMAIVGASAASPSVTTTNPTAITTNSATLNGTVHPNGLATSAYFEWGATTNYGSVTALQLIGAGSGTVALQANLTSLLTDTNYHYRLVASNSAGVSYGNDVIVTPTLLLFLYAGESWTYAFHDLPFSSFLLSSTVNPGMSRSILSILPGSFSPGGAFRFELLQNSTDGAGLPITVTPSVNPQNASPFVSLWLNDLEGGIRLTMLTGSVVISSMYIQQIGNNSASLCPNYQNTVSTTRNPQPASLGTQFVSSVTISSAVVTLDINAKNLSTGTFVQWGTTTNYGSASGATFVNFDYFVRRDITVSNLAPGTLYHLRVVATNSEGATYGNDLALTTPSPATVVTQPANNRKTTSATLNATAYVNGLATATYFDWGTTTNYNQVTPLQNLGSPIAVTNVSAPLSGLAPQTTYHFRAVVFSSGVTNFGSDVAFSTTPPPTNLVVTNLVTDDVRGAIERGGLVTFACDGTLVLSNQIEIANDVCLDATGHSITFSGSNVTRIFKVLPGTLLTLTNIALVNGRSTNGGAIYNDGTVRVSNCRFFSNTVIGAVGSSGTNGLDGTNGPNCQSITPGIPGAPGSEGQAAFGGAVLNNGGLTVFHCSFANNSAVGGVGGSGGRGGNGGRYPTASRPDCAHPGGRGGSGGRGGEGQGAAIASFGTLWINGCSFSNSVVVGGTGGSGGVSGFGGLTGFIPDNGMGGIGGTAQGSAIYGAGNSFISNSLFAVNAATGGGGGPGGGSGNNGAQSWGAVYMRSNCTIANCTMVGNKSIGGTGGDLAGPQTARGGNGGDAFAGALANGRDCLVVNLTLSSNVAVPGLGYVHPIYSTFNGKNGNSYGGSIVNTGSVFQIVNSILSGGFSNNCFGVITDLGHNISSDATPTWTSGTSLNNTDPLLLPLANNGGPTLTMALRAGSPALNSADCGAAPPTDQRGYPRPSGSGCDIGAYEGPGTTQLQIIYQNSSTNVLRWLADVGQVYRLETTSDFTGWTPYATNTAGANGWLDFPVPANPSPRFFRLLAQ